MKLFNISTLLFYSSLLHAAHTMNPAIISYLLDSNADRTLVDKEFVANSAINIQNPDRGFYDADYDLSEERDYNAFYYAKQDGFNMVYAPIMLDAYITTPTLPESFLQIIENNFQEAQAEKVKLILRIKYRNSGGEDASMDVIEAHLDQLSPLLQRYADTISIVQAGVIGAYGEWHSFSGAFASSDPNYKANRKSIVERLHVIFPNKFIQLRTTMHKEFLFGRDTSYQEATTTAQITPDIALTDNILAKIGQHNDCFLADYNDMGTFADDNISFWRGYMHNESLYAPVGGETCAIESGEDAFYTDCTHALTELQYFHYAYLNQAYQPDVIQKWKDQGCFKEISENLGYRFVATHLKVIQTATELNYNLSIENRGYSASYVDSNVSYILKNDLQSYEIYLDDTDMRTVKSDEGMQLKGSMELNNIEKGSYCLYLRLDNHNNGIKLANENLWSETVNANRLSCSIIIK